jgi:hypothetical protein
MIWRVFAAGCLVLATACGGAAESERAALTSAGAGSELDTGGAGRPEAGAPSVVAGGSAGLTDEGGAAGDTSSGGAEPSVAGGGSGGSAGSAAGAASVAGGGAGGASESIAGSAGVGGAWTPPDPDCQISPYHALPLKCMPPQPIDCRLPGPGGDSACTGSYGACPSSNPSGQYCHPLTDKDYSLCPPREGVEPDFSKLLKSCPKDTCGTDAGVGCRQTTIVDGKTEFCPCVTFGVVVPYPCGENGTVCASGVTP